MKTSDINREHASFELVREGVSLLTAGFSDEGTFEIEFYAAIEGLNFDYSIFEALVAEAKRLAVSDLGA